MVKESGWDTITESPFGMGGPKNMSPAVVRVLHDASKKTLEAPKVLETLDRVFQPIIYRGTEDYTRYGQQTFEAEKSTIERLGLAKKT
jgi:tripartite-type tricarboxylate transporter receptor subunit TctC